MTSHILMKIGEDFFPIKVGGKDPKEGKYGSDVAHAEAKRAENNLRRLRKKLSNVCDPVTQLKINEETEKLRKAKERQKREVIKDIKLSYMAWIPKHVATKIPAGTKTVQLKLPDRIETVELRKTSKGYVVKNPRTGSFSVFFVGQPFSKLTDDEIWQLTNEAFTMLDKIHPESACKK